MARHNLHRVYVAQYEVVPDSQQALRAVPAKAVASLNTHDMPPFAAFWQGLDIQDRLDLGLITAADITNEKNARETLKESLARFLEQSGYAVELSTADPEAVIRAMLRFLLLSPARVVLVNLEDLWLETAQQNVPGTWHERPNWLRKARLPFEAFSKAESVVETLLMLSHLHKYSIDEGGQDGQE